MHCRIGTRGSRLALAQAELVKRRLEAAYGDDSFELVILSSRGDRDRVSPLEELGAGAFVRDLEERLLAGEVDLLVHSMKDLPAEMPPGLTLAKAWTRADARDALVSRTGLKLADLPRGAIVATGSVRRTRFLGARRPDLRFVPIRGNVDTRLARLFGKDQAQADAPPLDALVLACAGLDRLGMSEAITERLEATRPVRALPERKVDDRADLDGTRPQDPRAGRDLAGIHTDGRELRLLRLRTELFQRTLVSGRLQEDRKSTRLNSSH